MTESSTSRRIRTYWIVGIGLSVLAVLFNNSEWLGSETSHTVMEAVATALALMVGVMALVRYYTLRESIFLIIGVGFLGTAFLDGFHTVVTATAIKARMPSDLGSLIPWSWISSRFFLSIILVASWIAFLREERSGGTKRIDDRIVYISTAAFTLASFLFFVFVPLPRAYYPELFFGRPEDLVPGLFFGIALFGYLRKGGWKSDVFEHWLVIFLIVGAAGQLVFMSFATDNFDFNFDVAHMLKKVSYVCVLTGLLVSMSTIFIRERSSTKALNAALEKREIALVELKRSNEELDAFSYIASHDLKEPLRGIHNYSQFLIEDYSQQLGDEGRSKLETLKRLATRMDHLIDALLRFSLVGRVELELTQTNTGDIARDTIEFLSSAIEDAQTQIEIAPDLPDVVCDQNLVAQVFQNLMANAIKYSAERPGQIEIGWNGEAQLPIFHVRDNGIGIREKDFDVIFQIFKRLHGRDKFGGGLGSGLTFVKKIIERHDGRIWIESQEGEGSTFFFTLSGGQ